MCYTATQRLGRRDNTSTVITVAAMDAESTRPSKGFKKGTHKGRVKLLKNGRAKIVLMRFDDETQTLTKKQRYMKDWVPFGTKVDAAQRQAEALYESERRHPTMPWSRPDAPRRRDRELEENAANMAKVPNPDCFRRTDGSAINPPRVVDVDPEDAIPPMDETGWPDPDCSTCRGQFRYRKYVDDCDLLVDEDVPIRFHDTWRGEGEQLRTQLNWESKRPSKRIDVDLLAALRQLRSGEIKSNDPVFKEFDLHHLANALRKGSPTMKLMLAQTLHNVYAQKRNLLDKEYHEMDETRDPRRKTLLWQELLECHLRINLCEGESQRNRTFRAEDFVDPIYAGQLAMGWKRHDCVMDLKERVYCGLHNLGVKMEQGEELLNHRELEYQAQRTLTPIEVEWSDDDQDDAAGIENDVPYVAGLDAQRQPSRRWMKKHMSLEEDQEFCLLVKKDNKSKEKAKTEGTFNPMDGRYHKVKASEVTEGKRMADHALRTQNRRLCRYITRYEGCRGGWNCTQRHAFYDGEINRKWKRHDDRWSNYAAFGTNEYNIQHGGSSGSGGRGSSSAHLPL